MWQGFKDFLEELAFTVPVGLVIMYFCLLGMEGETILRHWVISREVFYWSFAIVSVASVFLAGWWLAADHGQPADQNVSGWSLVLGSLFLGAVLGLLSVGMISGWVNGGWALVNWLIDPNTRSWWAYIAVGSGTLIVGGLLFWVRLRLRSVYGLLEVVAAVLVSVYQIDSQKGQPASTFLLAYLTAALYVTVRGLDNIHVALKADQADPALRVTRLFLGWVSAKRRKS